MTAVFLSVHKPADTGHYPHQGDWLAVAVAPETRLVRSLSGGSGAAMVVTGDMNDGHSGFCRYTASGLTQSARTSSVRAGCHVARSDIDWIFGTNGVQFNDYTKDRGRLVRWTTDHPLVLARAHIG
jgi:hypothetical protein